MIDKKAIKRYHKRVDKRLAERGMRFDGYRFDFNDKHDENGRFAPKDGAGSSGGGGKTASQLKDVKPRGNTPKLMRISSSEEFHGVFNKNRDSMEAERRWRVSADYTVEDYNGMKKYVNKNGSTFALHGTDIVSVCANSKAHDRGADVLADAVAAGGNKLDAYAGIYGFYQKCGFEPVSWTEWDDDYANEDWLAANGYDKKTWENMKVKPTDDELKVKREPIVFFKYTGKVNTISLEDFKKSVQPKSYEDAMKERDDQL